MHGRLGLLPRLGRLEPTRVLIPLLTRPVPFAITVKSALALQARLCGDAPGTPGAMRSLAPVNGCTPMMLAIQSRPAGVLSGHATRCIGKAGKRALGRRWQGTQRLARWHGRSTQGRFR